MMGGFSMKKLCINEINRRFMVEASTIVDASIYDSMAILEPGDLTDYDVKHINKFTSKYSPCKQSGLTAITTMALTIADDIKSTDYVDVGIIAAAYDELRDGRYDLLFKTLGNSLSTRHIETIILELDGYNGIDYYIDMERLTRIKSSLTGDGT